MTLRTALIVDGSSDGGQRALRDLENSMEQVEHEAGQMGQSVGAVASKMARDAQMAASGIGSIGRQSSLNNHHLANLGFQLQDIVVALQMGQNPMQVFLQQGGQIGQIMGQAGIGVGGLVRELGGMAVRFAAAHPILLATAAAAGVAAVGIGFLADRVTAENKGELDAYAASLGLTAEQLSEVGGAAVTTGDMLGGLWDVVSDAIGLEQIFADLKEWMVETFTSAAQNAKQNLSEIYAAGAATVDTFGHVWRNIGPIIGDAVISGANIAIGALEWLINTAIDGINRLALVASPILALANMAGIDTQLDHVDFGQMANPYAGAGERAADVFVEAYQRRLGEAQGAFDTFMDDWTEAAIDRRNRRLLSGVDDDKDKGSNRTRAARLTEEEKAYRAALKAAQDYSSGLAEEVARLGLNKVELKEREAVLAATAAAEAALHAPTKAGAQALLDQSVAIMRNFEAWKTRNAGLALEEHDKRIEQIRDETSLLGLVGSARDKASLALEEEGYKAKLAAEGIEDVNAAWLEYLTAQSAKIDRGDQIDAEKKAAERLANTYRDLSREALGALDAMLVRGESVADTMERLAQSIASAALEATLLGTGPLAGLFGGSGGGLLNSIFSTGGPVSLLSGTPFGRASGGSVARGTGYHVNENSTSPGLFFPLAAGRIEPPGRSGSGGPAAVEIHISSDGGWRAEVQQISGDVAVGVVREAAPALIEASAAETSRRMTRPRM